MVHVYFVQLCSLMCVVCFDSYDVFYVLRGCVCCVVVYVLGFWHVCFCVFSWHIQGFFCVAVCVVCTKHDVYFHVCCVFVLCLCFVCCVCFYVRGVCVIYVVSDGFCVVCVVCCLCCVYMVVRDLWCLLSDCVYSVLCYVVCALCYCVFGVILSDL